MTRINLLIINVVLAVSVHAVDNTGPRLHQFTVPLPPIPFFGHIPFQNIQLPVISTIKHIKNTIPGPGQLFKGVFAQSSSGLIRGKDGKLMNSGGTYVVTNNNGQVKEYKKGDSPPDLSKPIRAPTMPKMPELKFAHLHMMKPFEPFKFEPITFKPIVFEPIKTMDDEELKTYQPKDEGDSPPDLSKPIRAPMMPKMPELKFAHLHMMKPFEPFKFEPITFKPIVFEPIKTMDDEELKTYQPKDGEKFFGSKVSTSQKTVTVNGKTVSEASGSVIVNDNGKTDEQHTAMHESDADIA